MTDHDPGNLPSSQSDYRDFERKYFEELQGAFYGPDYYRLRDREEESAIVYGDDEDKALFSYIIKDFFKPTTILEVGCAMGYLVKQLVAYGFFVRGIDFSEYCLERVPEEIKAQVKKADLFDLPFSDSQFDMVVGLDILEHLPPTMLQKALQSIHRVLKPGGIYFGVIPAYGPNKYGPLVFDYYQRETWVRDAEAGRPFQDIPLDVQGKPHMGHLIHATVDWWEKQFAGTGFHRLGWLEQAIHRIYDTYLERGRWGIFIFKKKKTPLDALFHAGSIEDRRFARHCLYRPLGMYNWEYWPDTEWVRWTGVVAAETVKRKGRYLIIPYLVAHPDCSPDEPVIVSFSLNNAPMLSFHVTSPGWRYVRLRWRLSDRIGCVRMTVSRGYVPARSGKSDDYRELGIALQPFRQPLF